MPGPAGAWFLITSVYPRRTWLSVGPSFSRRLSLPATADCGLADRDGRDAFYPVFFELRETLACSQVVLTQHIVADDVISRELSIVVGQSRLAEELGLVLLHLVRAQEVIQVLVTAGERSDRQVVGGKRFKSAPCHIDFGRVTEKKGDDTTPAPTPSSQTFLLLPCRTASELQ